MKFSTLKLLLKLVVDAARIRTDEDWTAVYEELQGTISMIEKMEHPTAKIPVQMPINIIEVDRRK